MIDLGDVGESLIDPGEAGEKEVFLEPRDSYTDTGLDLNGDGIVDRADLHEFAHEVFDLGVHGGDAVIGDAIDHDVSVVSHDHHDDGLFDG